MELQAQRNYKITTIELYVYFYGRAQQLLKKGGTACFISSNKWLRAGYGEKLRRHLLDKQAFRRVVDFGELPVFDTAATFPAIFLWQKKARQKTPTHYAVVQDLQACYNEGVLAHVEKIGESLPASQFGLEKPRLVSRKAASLREKMEAHSLPLGEYVGGKIYYGIKTGLNEAFVIDRITRDALIEKDPKSAEMIKPMLAGDDIRHYEIHNRERYLIWTYIGVPIENYPAVLEHLKKHEKKAKKRWDKGNHWWELRACAYYEAFDEPKIIYPVIGKRSRFFMEEKGFLANDKTFLLPVSDWFLLGLLNTETVFDYLKTLCSVLGDEVKGGRLEFRKIYMETLPIPDAPEQEKESIGNLAKETQNLHSQRRAKVEQFLVAIGSSPAASNSRNPLENPWLLEESEFEKRAKKHGTPDAALFKLVRDETASLTKEIAKLESEIDTRVASLYGVG